MGKGFEVKLKVKVKVKVEVKVFSLNFHNLLIHQRIYMVTAFRLYRMEAGEFSECRQYGMFYSEMKAGEAQGLFAVSMHHDTRVHMPAEAISLSRRFVALNVMGKRKFT